METNIRQNYNSWASQYDTNKNKTRDVEAFALRNTLDGLHFEKCLEIGCGTGKNTLWLLEQAKEITAVDFSEEMLVKAQQKIKAPQVNFIPQDITQDWKFVDTKYDLITFSLVLEHIQNLDFIFQQIKECSQKGTLVYIGELHPFKQYQGSKARFETAEGVQILDCFNHHISDFTQLAKNYQFEMVDLQEYFDDDNNTIPRILTLLLRSK